MIGFNSCVNMHSMFSAVLWFVMVGVGTMMESVPRISELKQILAKAMLLHRSRENRPTINFCPGITLSHPAQLVTEWGNARGKLEIAKF